ncbi:MAG: NUDIX domain-containing protein [Deltaproteobacteria bacterium]|nr:NUDIX domain-containing protein [Deltaproteobacteria bacterium]
MAREISYNYCPRCAGRFEPAMADVLGFPPLCCSQCGLVYYLDPKLACAGLLAQDGRVLLVKRAWPPQKGKWCLPGGFVNRGEIVEQAAVREVREETGLIVQPRRLIGLYSYEADPVIVAIYEMSISGGTLNANAESSEVRWFAPSEFPIADLAFKSASDALNDWLKT